MRLKNLAAERTPLARRAILEPKGAPSFCLACTTDYVRHYHRRDLLATVANQKDRYLIAYHTPRRCFIRVKVVQGRVFE